MTEASRSNCPVGKASLCAATEILNTSDTVVFRLGFFCECKLSVGVTSPRLRAALHFRFL
jgi:hypothetical protein